MVAHFHYVLFGTIVFATYAGIYFWFPKMTGRMLDETLGKVALLADVHRLPHHVPGPALAGQRGHAPPLRRLPAHGRLHHAEHISTIGAFILGASTLPFIWNVFKSYRYGEVVTVDDPWGYGNSLEWATSLPAAAAQLHRAAPDPFRAPGVRAALPAHGRADAAREAHVGRPSRHAARREQIDRHGRTERRRPSPNGVTRLSARQTG